MIPLGLEAQARLLAGRHWDRLTAAGHVEAGFDFCKEYPSRQSYVNEWWEERFLPHVPNPRASA